MTEPVLGNGAPTLGAHLRVARSARGLSITELASKTGLSRAYLSKLEQDQSSPTVQTLYTILRAMGVSLAELFLEIESPVQPVVRVDERRKIQVPGAPGVTWEMLTPPGAKLELFNRYVEPGASSGQKLHTHPGSETGVVLEGRLKITVGTETFDLGPGDAINFVSDVPHRYWNEGEETCVAVWAQLEESSSLP